MSSRSISSLDPVVQPYFRWLIQVGEYLGLRPQITSTRRSRADQERLYARYLRGESQYPVAKPGTSLHERGLALDLVSEDNALLGAYWRHYVNGFWSPGDAVHFDVRYWLSP